MKSEENIIKILDYILENQACCLVDQKNILLGYFDGVSLLNIDNSLKYSCEVINLDNSAVNLNQEQKEKSEISK